MIVEVVSLVGSDGERAVNWNEVKGKVAALGFPARREITPGVASSGKRPRTVKRV